MIMFHNFIEEKKGQNKDTSPLNTELIPYLQ